ncbi:undecaprenyl-diphosphatase [Deinobacterium chartae]|uniref:Undecaprenyl-diphosphatase n=1 Tax=Deinobacterium chartae TaxID=521158 RepID=A0A841HV34_9DEIO|nr:undecaprenyl-diphosphatase [Deinobacterium chartae]
MDIFQAVILGIVQGLTEFLPISSSAHLRVFPALFGWQDPGASFTAVTQIGTEAAVLIYFRKDIWNILSTWFRAWGNPALRGDLNTRLGWYIIVGTLPLGILGLLFEDQIKTSVRDLRVIAATLIGLGIVLWIADRVGRQNRSLEALKLRSAFALGCAQALALIPGVSRSGATISAGLFLGFDRAAASRYAFLLAIPAVVASGLFQLPDAFSGEGPGWGPTLIATALAFVSGYASIAWLLRYISTHSYLPFVIYRIALGLLILVLLATGALQPI